MFDDLHVPTSMQRMMETAAAESADDLKLQIAGQEEAAETLSETLPTASPRSQNKKALTDRNLPEKAKKAAEVGANLPVEGIKDSTKETADEFARQHPELDASALILLKKRVQKGDDPEKILNTIREFYKDVTLIDEALGFLIRVSADDPELSDNLLAAQNLLREHSGREITAGRNIQKVVLEASSQGLGTPSSLRDLYRDITGNRRETTTLFDQLANKYPYHQLKDIIAYLLHSAGTDLKAEGPSIPPGLLSNLILEVRSLQAVLGVYNFFKSRMPLLEKLMAKDNIPMPPELTFEALAKHFMTLIDDRYPSADKVLQGALKLGINQWVQAKIHTFSQERDGVREVAFGQIFRSTDHRKSVLDAIIAALETLEEELDDLISRQEDEDFG